MEELTQKVVVNPLPDLLTVFGSVGKVKILLMLAKRDEMNITALSKETGLNHSKVSEHIAELIQLHILQEKRFGRIRIIGINETSEAGRRIKEFLKSWNNSYEVFTLTPL